MTEKNLRRGIVTPESYTPDVLQITKVSDLLDAEEDHEEIPLISSENTIADLKSWLTNAGMLYECHTLFVVDYDTMKLMETIDKKEIVQGNLSENLKIKDVLNAKIFSVFPDQNFQVALKMMMESEQDLLPVLDKTMMS